MSVFMFMADLNSARDTSILDQAALFLPKYRREKIRSYKFQKDKKLSVLTWALLRYSLSTCGCTDFEDKIIFSKAILCDDKQVITLLTKKGLMHRFYEKSCKEVISTNKNGLSALPSLEKDDEILAVNIRIYNENDLIFVYSKHENRYEYKVFKNNEILIKSRIAKGVPCISFFKKDPGEVYNFVITSNNFRNIDNKGKIKNVNMDLEITNRLSKPTKVLPYIPLVIDLNNYIISSI